MRVWPSRVQTAVIVLGVAGAVLGIAAGFVQIFLGPTIPEWTGDKNDTTELGLATIALSLVAAASLRFLLAQRAWWLQVASGVVAIAAVVVCFTTVGRLWYVPGPLFLAAVVLALLPRRPR